jgi:shikimate kinase
VGLPGAGKTTAGRIAARLLETRFCDLDELIVQRSGKSVPRMFEEAGEAAFRAIESAVAREVIATEPGILAPGGGFFSDPDNRREMLERACVIYLHVSPSVAARRIGSAEGRPLLKGYDITLRLAQILQQREAAYLQAPSKVSTDMLAPEQVAERIVVLARSGGDW